ncbi:MAG: hypothetical protein GF404_08825 [candidate division Zixibacteria bacterium]|nr:hypothetical protein [candidate division Zixibacteria bacterium]
MSKLEEIRQGTSSSAELISRIADYVRDQIRYVAVAIDEGRFTPRFCSQTASNHYGDCKDKSALMVAMLKASGFNASPVLVAVNSEVDTGLYYSLSIQSCNRGTRGRLQHKIYAD